MDLNQFLFEEEAYQGERTALRFRWILIAVVFVFITATFIRGNVHEAVLSFIPAGVFLIYNLVLSILIKEGKNLYFLRYFSVTIDILALSSHIYINSIFFSPIGVSTAASLFIYPILMFLSVLRYDKPLIIYATALVLVIFNINYIIQYQNIDKAVMDRVISSDPMGQLYKSGYLLILGIFFMKIPDMVSRYIQRQKDMLDEKNEYVLDLLLEKREKKNLKASLTELNALHNELQQKSKKIEFQNQKLTELVQTKDRLISFISHDLKNSFSTMSSIIATTRDNLADLDGKELSTAMDILHKHSLTNHVLFENMLQWAKLQRGQITVNKEKVKLIEFCMNIKKHQENELKSKNLKLNVSIAEDIFVLADPLLLTSVCNNILGNSIKFSKRGEEIKIGANTKGKNVFIKISDHGIGISPEKLAKIFKIENSKSSPGTEGEKGSGFGLILCKELVERNGGTISIESREGIGTIVVITLVNVNYTG